MVRETTREEKKFREFREAVKEYDQINIDTLQMLILRHTSENMGRRFFNSKHKLKYYKFWIKRLVSEGTLKSIPNSWVWKVIK